MEGALLYLRSNPLVLDLEDLLVVFYFIFSSVWMLIHQLITPSVNTKFFSSNLTKVLNTTSVFPALVLAKDELETRWQTEQRVTARIRSPPHFSGQTDLIDSPQ